MDPLAHTLAGAALAETRLGKVTPLAAPALILGSNLPDIDAVAMLVDRDLALAVRRGWTHGVLALVVLPVVLTLALLLLDRSLARRRGQEPRARAGPLLGISALAVASHSSLDWLNTYGVRLLMPFDGTWFYGDALFIVDAWVWLMLGAPVVLARSATPLGCAAWTLLGLAATWLVVGFEGLPVGPKLLWCAGVAAIVWLRLSTRWRQRTAPLATLCITATGLFLAFMVAGSQLAERQAAEWLAQRGNAPEEVMASPVPGNPLRRNIVAADGTRYRLLEVDWLSAEPVRTFAPPVDRGDVGPIVQAALAAPQVRGLAAWIRFPAYRVEETEEGHRVSIFDVRYSWRAGNGFGTAVVELDRDLRVLAR